MDRRRIVSTGRVPTATVVLVLLATALTSAAEFWDTAPFTAWSEAQVQRIMTASPWSFTIVAPLPPDAKGRPGPSRKAMLLSWRSALPVRQAMVRSQAGSGGRLNARQQDLLRPAASYTIAVGNMPYPFQPGQVESFLKRKKKPPIAASRVSTQKIPTGWELWIEFPRTDPLTLDDGEVEFTFRAATFGANIAFSRPLAFKRTFKLKRMTVGGRLEL